MADTPDFDFSFGKDKHLKGWGWRGLGPVGIRD